MSSSKKQRINQEDTRKGSGKSASKGSSNKRKVVEPEPQVSAEPQVQMTTVTRAQAIEVLQSQNSIHVAKEHSWHTCQNECVQLNTDNLTYRYLYQPVCPSFNSNWLTRLPLDWHSTIVSREESQQDNPDKDRLATIKLVSSDDPITPTNEIIEKLKNDTKRHQLYLELKTKVVVQQIIGVIHRVKKMDNQ